MELTTLDATLPPSFRLVPTPQVKQVQAVLRALLQEPPAPNHALGVVVMAPSGWGKTSLVRDFLEQEGKRRGADLRTAFVALPANATPKNLASRTLEILGDPAPRHGNAADMTGRITTLLNATKYDLLVLDDVNNISDGESVAKRRQGARWIEEILNTSRTPIIMTARDEFRTVISENAHLARRLRSTPKLAGLRWTNKDDLGHFRYALSKMESGFGMATNFASSELWTSVRLCIATKGLLGHLEIAVRDATRLAKGIGMSSLSRDLLQQVIGDRIAMSTEAVRNPFEVEDHDLAAAFGPCE